jgi:hypothetical protein
VFLGLSRTSYGDGVTIRFPQKPTCIKRIVQDPLCWIYGLSPKTTVHILWNCASAMGVWMECNKRIQKLSLRAHDGFHLFEQLMGCLDEDELEVVIYLARQIWLRRNAVMFQGEFSSPIQLV